MNDIVNNKKGHNFMNDKNYWFIREYLEISSIYEHYKWQKVKIVNDTGVAWDDFMNNIMNDVRRQLWMTLK